MIESLYNKKVVCPVCQKKIEITRVRSRHCIASSRDSDFCVYYQGPNPIFYEAWVCGNCGYAAHSDDFENISYKDTKIVKENITANWKPRDFTGERDVDGAIEAFKLVLYNLCKINANPIEFAKVCLRIAWFYRIKEDIREMEFLEYALKYYTKTYETQSFPIGKLDQYTCMYMIAELCRRLEKFDDALVWFNRVISSQEARRNKMLIENAREQYRIMKEQMDKPK
ncbi:MAG: DUF2225 domain-containing protein [Clostridium sp.]|nr:DUF2225 domain-containing protein [Clostridium sp.]